MQLIAQRFLRRSSLVLAVVIMVACSWLAPLDSLANQQVDAGLKRALISFATARALNAVISMAQGTEVALEPGGVGVVLTPGQVLDPINDLVEKFSTLLLLASVSFGVQKMLLAMGAHSLVSILLSSAALGWAFFYLRQQTSPAWLTRVLVILLMTRFAVPIVTLGSDLLFQKFMAADYQSSQQSIDATSSQMGKTDSPTAGNTKQLPQASSIEEQGLVDKIREWWSPKWTPQSTPMPASISSVAHESPGALQNIKEWWLQNSDAKTRFENMKQSAEQAIEHIVKLIVIFLLQTLLIPLLLLWSLYSIAKKIFEHLPAHTSS